MFVYIAQFKDGCGYASAARDYLKLLYNDNLKNKFFTVSMNFENENKADDITNKILEDSNVENVSDFISKNKGKYVVFFHALPNLYKYSNDVELLLKNSMKNVNMVAWETNSIPLFWKDIYKTNLFQEIITFCNWNRETFEKETGLPTKVVPHFINIKKYKRRTKKDKFTIFSMSQWGHRKGFDIMIKSFFSEFYNNSDVELVIKTYRGELNKGSDKAKEKSVIYQEAMNYKNSINFYNSDPLCKVKIITDYLDKEKIENLYQESDIFCLATRGEGFGLTIAEALTTGLSCITPDKGGHTDFINAEYNFQFDCKEYPCFDMNSVFYSATHMRYYEPDPVSLMKNMRKAYEEWKKDYEVFVNKSALNIVYVSDIIKDEKIVKFFKTNYGV